jgi:hypothetical protein
MLATYALASTIKKVIARIDVMKFSTRLLSLPHLALFLDFYTCGLQ